MTELCLDICPYRLQSGAPVTLHLGHAFVRSSVCIDILTSSNVEDPRASHGEGSTHPDSYHEQARHRLRVLFVDDEIDEDDALVRLLRLDQLSVECVASGHDAIALASNEHDVVVLDLHLGDTSGFSVLTRFRETGLRAPVIAITGWYAEPDYERQAKVLGAAAFMRKPLDASELALQIAALHERRRSEPAPSPLGSRRHRTAASATLLSTARMASLHDDILRGGSAAREELCELLLTRIKKHLRARWTAAASDEDIRDAAVDALLGYLADPAQYESTKSPLPAYLCLAARRNLMNRIESDRRRLMREAEFAAQRTCVVEAQDTVAGKLATVLAEATKDFTQSESAILRLWLSGERNSEAYADVLGIGHLPVTESRRLVRSAKERVVRRVQRWAARVSRSR